MTSNHTKAYLEHGISELKKMRSLGEPIFTPVSDQSYIRGVDFYSESKLLQVMVTSIANFHQAHGFYPSISEPVGFNEWVTRRKFLDYFMVPESGNKLLTKKFIPSICTKDVRCADVMWRSAKVKIPSNKDIPPGRYFFKSSHGSGFYKIINYPLRPLDRVKLLYVAAKWLMNPFGLSTGEWWYNAFQPEIFIEEYLGDNLFSINFFCFRGLVALIVFHSKWTKESITLMPDFSVVGNENDRVCIEQFCTDEQLKKLRELASKISLNFTFVRVDFLIAENEELILGELTFTPGDGLSKRPLGIDQYLGDHWARVHV